MLHRAMPPAADQVHVWQTSLAASPLPDLPSVLSPDELERADRFGNPARRSAFLVARATLRGVLAHELGTDPAVLRFAIGPHGKPFLDNPSTALRFNLSHSGDIVLCAVAWGRDVGVDVERIKPDIDHTALARRFFSPLENQELASLPPALQRAAFFAAWTRKEALVKAWGAGLSLALSHFDVSVHPHRPAQLLGVREGPGRGGWWSVHELAPGPGYAGAVAVEGPPGTLLQRHWSPDGAEPAPRRRSISPVSLPRTESTDYEAMFGSGRHRPFSGRGTCTFSESRETCGVA